MPSHLIFGIFLVLLAGAMCGNCMTPLRGVRNWKWENAWLIFSFVSLLLIPSVLAVVTIPHLTRVYFQVSLNDLLVPLLFGAGWGIAQVLFGISVVNLGMALGFSIIVGLGALFGTLVPVLVQRRELLATPQGSLLLTGTAVMLAGVAVCGYAGRERERSEVSGAARRVSGYGVALALAVLCGVLAPMVNFALAFGENVARQAVQLGAAPANAPFAVWPVALAGGFIPNAGYSMYLLSRNRSWSAFRTVWPETGYSALMGLLWMGAVALYGVATRFLGTLGTSTGWGLYQIFMILAANGSGLLMGEWAEATRGSVRVLLAGLALLAVATVLMSIANL
jgi:L-rhamnose-H+ transport protein